MVVTINRDLQVPFEIGAFIQNQVQYLHPEAAKNLWTGHANLFDAGPNPFQHQMKQGLILEVENRNLRPRSIYSRYGEWVIIGTTVGSFKRVFEVVRRVLGLRKIEHLSNWEMSYWAIHVWDGQSLLEPDRKSVV